jgi:hypothetical protein
MEWIKRNLYFVIGAAVALVLMGLAGWYLYSKWDLNNANLAKLEEGYAKLKELNSANPHWGSGDIDNIKTAKEERDQLRAFIEKARQYFQRIPAIPTTESGKVTSQEFSTALSRTIDHLQRDAVKANVTLPTNTTAGRPYAFSFDYQSQSVTFAPGSLEALATQLGEVNAICGILFDSKINALDYIRRERVSDDDLKGPQEDYVAEKTSTNELALLTPYELGFRCFSGELAAVMAGFGKSPNALVIKNINVEHTTVGIDGSTDLSAGAAPVPAVAAPIYMPPPPQAERPRGPQDDFARRYGTGLGGGVRPAPVAQPVQQPQYVAPRAPTRTGLPVALDEKQLKVTMNVVVVKLLQPSTNSPAK